MLDFKAAAAGEEVETDDPFLNAMKNKMIEAAKRHGHTLEFIEGALDYLLRQTRTTLSEMERIQAMMKLATYPEWKLLELDKFNGFFSEHVRFLDELNSRQTETYSKPKQLPDHTDLSKQIAKDFNEHIKKVMNFDGTSEERRKWEWESFKELDRKYPHLNVLSQVRGEKKFHQFQQSAAGRDE